MKLKDKIIQDFTGGLVTNKSDQLLQDNELKNSMNLDLDEKGRLKRRRGTQQWGNTAAGILDDSVSVQINTAGSTPIVYHLLVQRASTPKIYYLRGCYNTVAVAVGDATITVISGGVLAAGGGTVEINGDLIAYTGATATTITLTAVATRAHPAFSAVNQTTDTSAAAVPNTAAGVYFAVLGNKLYIQGRLGGVTFDGSDFAAVGDTDEAAALFATNYRDRIYGAGSGATDGAGTRNGSPIRVSFTEPGDATDWGTYTVNFFDVEDDRGESITGLKEMNDVLLIFKMNSIFSYDEVQLKQRLWNVGAYNHKVIKRIGENLFTFCPAGVFVTNGASAQLISEPVKKYLDDFQPSLDSTVGRVVNNCFAGTFDNKYFLYLGDIREPDINTDVVLVYDTIKNNWTVYDGFTNITHFASLYQFNTGSVQGTAATYVTQSKEALFAGDTGGKYFRFYENRFFDNQATRTQRGGDIYGDMMSDSVGNSVQTVAETKLMPIGDEPTQWTSLDRIAVLTERGTHQVSYKIDRGEHGGMTDWISLGDFKTSITTRKLKHNLNQGYRIAFRITTSERDTINIFNGIIMKGRETIEKDIYGI